TVATSSSTSCSPRCGATTTSKSCGRRRRRDAAASPKRRWPPSAHAAAPPALQVVTRRLARRDHGVCPTATRVASRMKLRIVALGHRLPAWAAAAFDDYARRLPREFALETIELKPNARTAGKTTAQVLSAEATRIAAACAGFEIVALDEHGEAWTTARLAKRLGEWNDQARAIAF